MENKAGIDPKDLEKLLLKTEVFPDYIKDIYLAKLKEKSYSDFWLNKVYEIISELESLISKK